LNFVVRASCPLELYKLNAQQLTSIQQRHFSQPIKRAYLPFGDVPDTHWAINAIKKIYEPGFYLFPVPCYLPL
jgi:hypothetical protein